MKTDRRSVSMISLLLSVTWMLFALSGCAAQGYSVIASTATVIGVNLSQQPTNGVVDATLGYKRAELAFVPTNRNGSEASTGSVLGGAKDSADVIMELRYDGIMSTTGGIYQRLAVGKNAVTQTGAAVMFAKGPDGKTDEGAVRALKAIQKLPAVDSAIEADKDKILKKYNAMKSTPADEAKFTNAAKTVDPKYNNIGEFLSDGSTTADQITKIKAALADAGITIN